MKRLTTVGNSIDATLLQHKLQQEGIPSFLTNENMGTMFPHFTGMLGYGIQVMVRETDYEKALEVLTAAEEKRPQVCPECGSANIGFGIQGRRRVGDKLLILVSVLFGMPMGNIRNKYYCKDCGADFV